jgi:hypothetical protein
MAFTPQQVEQVWNKARIVPPNDPNVYRQDRCTAYIRRLDYGNCNSAYGWEIDHIIPNGNDDLSNLQPLHWQNNRAKGDGVLVCAVVSSGNGNVARR